LNVKSTSFPHVVLVVRSCVGKHNYDFLLPA